MTEPDPHPPLYDGDEVPPQRPRRGRPSARWSTAGPQRRRVRKDYGGVFFAVLVLILLALAGLLAVLHWAGIRPAGLDLLRIAGACFCCGVGVRLLRMRVASVMSAASRHAHGVAGGLLLGVSLFLFEWAAHPHAAAAALAAAVLAGLGGLCYLLMRGVIAAARAPGLSSGYDEAAGKRWKRVAVMLWLLLIPATGCGLGVVLHKLSRQYVFLLPGAQRYVMEVHLASFFLPLLLYAGAVVSPPLAIWLVRLLSGRRFADYARHAGLDDATGRGLVGLLVGAAVVATAMVAPLLNTYAVVRDDHIAVRDSYVSPERRYAYGEVRGIILSSHALSSSSKREFHRPSLTIEFTDGERIATYGAFRSFDAEADPEMLAFIAERSGCPIQQVRLAPEH